MIFRTLVSQWSSLVISLFLAVFVWAVATNEENPTRENIFQEPIPIQFTGRGDGLTILETSADTVRIRIRAPEASWQTLRASNFQAVASLKDLGPGVQVVQVNVTSDDPQVTVVAVENSPINVKLDRVKQVQLDVRPSVLDNPPLGYEFKNVQAQPGRVTVVGPESIVDQVNDATAEVALRGAKTAIDRDAPVTLHDAQGNVVRNLTITPSTVSVHVDVVQRVGYKEVAVKAVLRGAVSSGYWISDIKVDPPTVTLVGAAEALDQIPGYVESLPVNVTGSREGVTKQVGLSLPADITVLNASTVSVKVSVEPLLGGITILRTVTASKVGCDLPTTVSPDTVEVILSGPLPILQAMTPDDLQVVVDVNGCAASTFQATPRAINVPDSVKVESIVPNTVEVNVKSR